MKIIDAFIFYNEYDLLEIRLEELWDVVDYFILCEATRTHTNNYKPLFFLQNWHRFKPYLSKLVYSVFDNYLHSAAPLIEYNQRRSLLNGLSEINISEQDILLLSDVDEIPNKKIILELKKISPETFPITLAYSMHYGCFANQFISPPNHLHNKSTVAIKINQLQQCNDLEWYRQNRDYFNCIQHAGWHFSYMGGTSNIINKLESFSHTEYNHPAVKNIVTLQNNIDAGQDLLLRPGYQIVKNYNKSNWPDYVLQNEDKFADLTAGNNINYNLQLGNDYAEYLMRHLLYATQNACVNSSKINEQYTNKAAGALNNSVHLLNNVGSLHNAHAWCAPDIDPAVRLAMQHNNTLRLQADDDNGYEMCYVTDAKQLYQMQDNMNDLFILVCPENALFEIKMMKKMHVLWSCKYMGVATGLIIRLDRPYNKTRIASIGLRNIT